MERLARRLELGLELVPECALCGLERHSSTRYLEGVANDGVNNIPLRRRLAQKGGFCARHCRAFAEQAHLLSAAILLEDFMTGRLERIEQGKRPRPIDCEACHAESKASQTLLRELRARRRRGSDPAQVQAILTKTPFCMEHLEMLAPVLPESMRRALAARQDELRRNLAELIRKHDYRFNHETLTESERRSVMHALELLGGRD